jgi:CubicO group peptidase (beta-lactamase class C family)
MAAGLRNPTAGPAAGRAEVLAMGNAASAVSGPARSAGLPRRAALQTALAAAAFVLGAEVRGRAAPPAAGSRALAATRPAGAALSGEAAQPTPQEVALAARVDRLLADLAAQRAFSGSALLAREGRLLLSKGYGWADALLRLPNTPATRFRIASLTKQFTALAVLQLQELGRLKVTDPLAEYLETSPPQWAGITLHHLLTHTSGIVDYDELPDWPTVQTKTWTPFELIGLFLDRPLLFAPGTGWSYSDSNYVLLGYVIERVSNLPYAQFLERHIFGPLGLRDTGYDAGHALAPRQATGYSSWGQVAPFQDMSVFYAAGALFSTVGDLWRWDEALRTGQPALAAPATIRLLFQPYVRTQPDDPNSPAYGYGWVIDRLQGRRMLWHPGDVSGFHSLNALFPDDGYSLVLLSNLESSDLVGAADRIAQMLFA